MDDITGDGDDDDVNDANDANDADINCDKLWNDHPTTPK